MRYFVRRDAPHDEPDYLFRVLPDVRVQLYDVPGHAWRPAPFDPLYRWAVSDPDMGVDEIDEAQANAIVRRFHRLDRRPAPTALRTAAELLDELGVSEEPIERQRRAVYKWLESHDLPDVLRHDLARRGLVGPLVGDVPQFRPAGDFLTVEGVLESLDVQGASLKRQRAAIARVFALDTLRPFLEKLAPQLRARGLLVDTEA